MAIRAPRRPSGRELLPPAQGAGSSPGPSHPENLPVHGDHGDHGDKAHPQHLQRAERQWTWGHDEAHGSVTLVRLSQLHGE